jgi:phytol kinase
MITGGEVRSVTAVCAACTLVLVLGEALHRRLAVPAEWTRKLVHVLMGLVAAAFPWLFDRAQPVVLVCAIFAALLGATLVASRLPSIHRVGRRTAGALWYPLAVAVVFAESRDRPELYVASILVLAFADPAAAVVGRSYGETRFGTARDAKSLEGSLAFLAIAWAILSSALALTTPLGSAAALAWGLAIAIVLAGAEAVAPAGSDNVLVPIGALVCLRAASPDATNALPGVLAFMGLVGSVALVARRTPRGRAHA